ncbi:MAG: hypothetical protein IT370_07630 [Deltaproteobacteria bacterium]|nr:hypothetical protein [Deltaproteobacteria bacterium]
MARSRMVAAVQVLPRQPSRWQEWFIILAVIAISAIGVVTVLGRDMRGWWRPGDASPGDGNGPGREGGPGGKPGQGPTGPTGPTGPAVPI